jgi:hypothetical protein
MQKKVAEKLEKLGGSLYKRPKGMRVKTFEKLVAKEREYGFKGEIAEEDDIRNLYGDSMFLF